MEYTIVQHGSPQHAQVDDLRERVLRRPLGLTLTAEDRTLQPGVLIFAAFKDGSPVASLMLEPCPAQTLKLRQMCVDTEQQQRGLGRGLVSYAEAHARGLGAQSIEMSARLAAAGFYEKLGYAAEGGIYDSLSIPHVKMRKAL